MNVMGDRKTCNKPDRHLPRLVCGFPLPCPYHTITLDTTGTEPTIEHKGVIDEKTQRRLLDIGDAIKSMKL